MHIMVVGLPGSGKGYVTQWLIDRMLKSGASRWAAADRARNALVQLTPLPMLLGIWRRRRELGEALRRDPRTFGAALKACRAEVRSTLPEYVDSPDGLRATTPLSGHVVPARFVQDITMCEERGIDYVDEMQDYFGARDFKKFEKTSIRWWTQHRHYDKVIISNTQHPDFVDKICRILTNEVWFPQMLSLPFLGWVLPSSRRPPQFMGEGRDRAARRDAMGDTFNWYRRLLGFGTVFVVWVYPPSILGEHEDLTPEAVAMRKKSRLRWLPHFVFFNIKFARRYDSGHIKK
jgi:hypothetical protein